MSTRRFGEGHKLADVASDEIVIYEIVVLFIFLRLAWFTGRVRDYALEFIGEFAYQVET